MGIVTCAVGVAIGFYVCKQTYQPQVAMLKEEITVLTAELETAKAAKENVRLVFSHNESCTVAGPVE